MDISPLLLIVLLGLTVTMTAAIENARDNKKPAHDVTPHSINNVMEKEVPTTTASPYRKVAKLLMQALEVELTKRTKVLEKKLELGENDINLVDSEGISGYRRVEEYVDEQPTTKDTKPAATRRSGPPEVSTDDDYWRRLYNERNNRAKQPKFNPLETPNNFVEKPTHRKNQNKYVKENKHQNGHVAQSKNYPPQFHPLKKTARIGETPTQQVRQQQNMNKNERGQINYKQPRNDQEQMHLLAKRASFVDGQKQQPQRLAEGKSLSSKKFNVVLDSKSDRYPALVIPKPSAYPTRSVTKSNELPHQGYAARGDKFSHDMFSQQRPQRQVHRNAVHTPHTRRQHPSKQVASQNNNLRQDDSYDTFHDFNAREQYSSQKVVPQKRRFSQDNSFHGPHTRQPRISQQVVQPEESSQTQQDETFQDLYQRRQQIYPRVVQQDRRHRGEDSFYDSVDRQQYPSQHTSIQRRSFTQDDTFDDAYPREQHLSESNMAPEGYDLIYVPVPYTPDQHEQAYMTPDRYEEVDIDKLDPNDFHVNFGPRDGKALAGYDSDRSYEDNDADRRYSSNIHYKYPEQHIQPDAIATKRMSGVDDKRYESNEYYQHPKTRAASHTSANIDEYDDHIPIRRDGVKFKQQFTSGEYEEDLSASHEHQSRRYPWRRYGTRIYLSPTSSTPSISSSSSESSEESAETPESQPKSRVKELTQKPYVPVPVTVRKHVAVDSPAITEVPVDKSARPTSNGTQRVCYECGQDSDQAEIDDGVQTVLWDRCRYAFHHSDAAAFGIKPIDCMDNCYIKVDKDNHVRRGCYRSEEYVSPAMLGCHKQGSEASVYCFCRGSKCNSANAPAFF